MSNSDVNTICCENIRAKKKNRKRAKIAIQLKTTEIFIFKRISQVPPISCSLKASDDFKPPL